MVGTVRLLEAPPVVEARPQLHLRPRSLASQRVWTTGSWDEHPLPESDLRLQTLPDDHRSFASLRAILEQLEAFVVPEERATTARLRQYMRDACPEEDPSAHGRMLADSVTFAIMRRVSRESVYTARLIDHGARTLNGLLARVAAGGRVHVPALDRIDRPTIKVLARAMLILEPTQRFAWAWHTSFDPLDDATAPGQPHLYHVSRRNLLRQLVAMLQPTMVRLPNGEDLCAPTTLAPASPSAISAALVVQNYDACLLLCDALEWSGTDGEVGEALRLRALAALNVGEIEAAVDSLARSEAVARSGGRRAHLAYLQGLIAAKRSYDLGSSRNHYERGLAAAQGAPSVEDEDLPLERAWLLNGLALNDAILWRRDQQESAWFDDAFSLVQQAFDLVREGPTPARMYLRFNLIANAAFLLEMRGEYQHALNIFGKAFELDVPGAAVQEHRWRSNINYRIGALHRRAGDLEAACTCLREAAKHDLATDTWATHERILRALGVVHLQRGAHGEAAEAFAAGLAACRRARSREGTLVHARGLAAALGRAGRKPEAGAVVEELSAEEGLTVDLGTDTDPVHGDRGTRLAPKLPAYIPEIDLEGIPAIDLNQFLGHPRPGPARPHGQR